MGLPEGARSLRIRLLVSIEYKNVTDERTGTAPLHRPRYA